MKSGLQNRDSHRNPPEAGGYTILEICLVLFIIALMVGLAIPTVSSLMAEQRLREPMRQIELLARTARHLASTQQRTYVLLINPDQILLETQEQYQADLASTLSSPVISIPTPPAADTDSSGFTDDADAPPPPSMDPVVQDYAIPEGLAITVRGWQETDWYEPRDRVWIFPPTGLCEPLEIHLQNGAGYIEQSFDPLTSAVKNEKFYLP